MNIHDGVGGAAVRCARPYDGFFQSRSDIGDLALSNFDMIFDLGK